MKTLVTVSFALFLFASLAIPARAQVLNYFTAKEYIDQVEARAQQEFGSVTDVKLTAILFANIEVSGLNFEMDIATGKATEWTYRYHSTSLDSTVYFAAFEPIFGGLQIVVLPGADFAEVPFQDTLAIYEPWVDSPDALQGMKNGGAQAFIQAHPEAKVAFAALIDNPVETPIAPAGKYWLIQIASGSDTISCAMEGETGVAVSCTSTLSTEDPLAARTISLDQSYPNPVSVRNGATVTFSVALPQPVHLALYDVLGKEVAVLYDASATPGSTTVTVNPGTFSQPGVYFTKMKTENGVMIRRMAVTP